MKINERNFLKIAPADNEIRIMGHGVWRAVYHNHGKLRMTFELVGLLFIDRPNDSGEPEARIQIISTGQTMSRVEFDEYRRSQWPMAHEVGRNPKNQTLGVQSTMAQTRNEFKQ